MTRWRALLPGLLLVVLVACGGTTRSSSGQTLADPTATGAPSRSLAPVAGASASAAPRASVAPNVTVAASAAATAPATMAASAPPPSPVATAVPQPIGTIPAGWQVYRGPPTFPIVVAYPPDWTVDDSLFPAQTVIFLYGPNGHEEDEVVEIVSGAQQTDANIDVLRDDFYQQRTLFCDREGVEFTEHRTVSNATFASLHAACDSADTLTFIQAAAGLKGGDEWDIMMRTPYARRDARLREVFDPILASINIYAQIAP